MSDLEPLQMGGGLHPNPPLFRLQAYFTQTPHSFMNDMEALHIGGLRPPNPPLFLDCKLPRSLKPRFLQHTQTKKQQTKTLQES